MVQIRNGETLEVQTFHKGGQELSLWKGKRVVFRVDHSDEGVPAGSRGTVTSFDVGDDITVYVSPDARPSIRLGFLETEVVDELADIDNETMTFDVEPLPIG